jgi:hypothetical protein
MTTVLTGSGDGGQGSTTSTSTENPGSQSNTSTSSSDTSTSTSWRDTLPEDIRSNGALAQFKDVPSLAKSYVHAQSLIGKKGVVLPSEKASDEEWTGFYQSLGQPPIDKFEIATPKDTPLNENFLKDFKTNAHKAGLLPKQAQGLLDWYLNAEKSMTAETQKVAQGEQIKNLDALKQEWGPGYSKQIFLAQTAAKELGGASFVEYLNQTGLGNDAQVIKIMAKAGALLGEDKLRGDGSGGQFGKTPAETRREINDIMGNPKHPYFDATHPGHKQAVADMSERYKGLS